MESMATKIQVQGTKKIHEREALFDIFGNLFATLHKAALNLIQNFDILCLDCGFRCWRPSFPGWVKSQERQHQPSSATRFGLAVIGLLLKFVISPMRLWRMFLNHEIAEFFYDQLYTWIPGLFRHKRRPMKGIQANFSLSLCMYTYALNRIDMWKCMYTCHFQIHALTHTTLHCSTLRCPTFRLHNKIHCIALSYTTLHCIHTYYANKMCCLHIIELI